MFSSARDLVLDDVPDELIDITEATEPQVVETTVKQDPMLVTAAVGPAATRYFLFFPLDQVRQGLNELVTVVIGAWLATVVAAAVAGRMVAARTLRPVGATAHAAESIAAGHLDARLSQADGDEFGALAASFNHMADQVERFVARLEQAAARERRFTADVAHELRTPLTGLSTAAGLLADRISELPPGLRRPTQILIGDVERLRALVLELLELSRLDAGVDQPQPVALRVADAVAAVVDGADLRRRATIVVDVDDTVVSADPSRLRRILSNVIDNAVIHGSDPVSVMARQDGDSVEIDVVDRGPGIVGHVASVFERFTKSDGSRGAGGSGLGLAIARQYARSMGGDVRAANDPRGGARLTITLPAGQASVVEIAERDGAATGP